MQQPDPTTIAARLRALAHPHSVAFHGWLAVYEQGGEEVRIDERALQAALIALADDLDPSGRGHVEPLDDPHVTALDFAALPLLRSAADRQPAA